MNRPAHYHNPYGRLAPFYDAIAWTLLAPFGGEDAFRGAALDALALSPGMKVLELGCGTGSNLRRLGAMGVQAVGVELSPAMFARATRRAPLAQVVHGDLLTYEGGGRFDRVLLSLVLHEMEVPVIAATLATARRALRHDGQLVVLDFARPRSRVMGALLGVYLTLCEPSCAGRFIATDLGALLHASGLTLSTRSPLALGTAAIHVARV